MSELFNVTTPAGLKVSFKSIATNSNYPESGFLLSLTVLMAQYKRVKAKHKTVSLKQSLKI